LTKFKVINGKKPIIHSQKCFFKEHLATLIIINMKQTAVEWLYEELILEGINVPKVFYDKAKEMEKEQMINAFDEGKSDGYKTAREWDEMILWSTAEQYYNETYKQQEQ
jgi:hypothetical protein